MGAHQTKMMGKVTLLFVVAMAAGANATACTITACTTTDGSTVAGGSGCYCGTDNVFVTATQFCYKKAGNTGLAMTKKLCAERTGANTNEGVKFTNKLCTGANALGTGDTSSDLCTCSTTLATPLTTSTNKYFIGANGVGIVAAAA